MKKIKRIVATLAITISLLSVTQIVAHDSEIKVTINGEKVDYTESSGFPFASEEERTLVPLRLTMEKLGTEVDWIQEESKATLVKDDIKIDVPLNERYILVNDEEVIIDIAPVVINERIFLPIRCVAESFGATVNWNQEEYTVEIVTNDIEEIDEEKGIPAWLDIEENVEVNENENDTDTELLETISNEDTNATVTVDDYLNVRKERSTTSESIKKLLSGERIKLLKKIGGWYEVFFDETGYVKANKSFIKVDDDAEIPEEKRLCKHKRGDFFTFLFYALFISV